MNTIKNQKQLDFLQLLRDGINFKNQVHIDILNDLDLNFFIYDERKNVFCSLYEHMMSHLSTTDFINALNNYTGPFVNLDDKLCMAAFSAIEGGDRVLIEYLLPQITNFDKENIYLDKDGEYWTAGRTLLLDAIFDLPEEQNDLFDIILSKTKNIGKLTNVTYYNGDMGQENGAHFAAYKLNTYRLSQMYYAGCDFSAKELYNNSTPCQALYASCLSDHKNIALFNSFMLEHEDLLNLELQQVQKDEISFFLEQHSEYISDIKNLKNTFNEKKLLKHIIADNTSEKQKYIKTNKL